MIITIIYLYFSVYGTYPLNPPKLPISQHYHKHLLSSSSSSFSDKKISNSDLPIQSLASLNVSHKGQFNTNNNTIL